MAAALPLHPGETLIEVFRANRTQGRRAVGGQLHVTSRRLVFIPQRMEAATGGRPWEVAWPSVSAVGIAPRGWRPFDGSLRRRFQVTTGETIEYFVVPQVHKVIQSAEAARRA